MIEIDKHIEILLLSNDCVIVPELGGFMAHHVKARYDEADGMFIPPLRTLGFNPQLTMNDSLLAQSYIEAHDISYPEAVRRIESEVVELRQHLDAEGYYELNDIGVLRLNDEGHLEFEPCEAGILTPTLYGLSAFEMPTLAAAHQAHEQSTPVPADEHTNSLSSDTVRETSGQGTPIPADEHTHRLSRNLSSDSAIVIKMSWIRNAVAAAAAIVAFFFIQTPVSNSYTDTPDVQQSAIVHIDAKKPATATPVTPAATEETSAATAAEEKSAAATTAEEPAAKEEVQASDKETPTPAATTYYYIVLASETTPSLAEGFISQLQQAGYREAAIREMQNSKKVRVVYGTFTSEQAAYARLSELRKDGKPYFADAWILKN